MKNDIVRAAQSNKNEGTEGESRSSFINKVTIDPGCITCGACEFISPEVFEVTDICRVKKNAPIKENQDAVRQASLACPVNVIKVEEE